MLTKVKGLLQNAVKKGFFHILLGNTLVKFITFFSSMLLPRILTKQEFGRLGFADNVYSYILLINGLGLANAVLRFASVAQDKGERQAVLAYSLRMGLLFDCLLTLCLLPVLIFAPLPLDGTRRFLFFILFMPFFTFAFDCITYYLRASLENRKFSVLTVFYSLVSAGLQLLLAMKFRVFGVFGARYTALLLAVAVGGFFLYKLYKNNENQQKQPCFVLSRDYKSSLFRFSLAALVANAFSLVMPLNEQFVITLLLKNEESVAGYRAASMAAQNIQFITMSVVVFIYPYFARHDGDGRWLWKNCKKVIGGLSLGIGALTALAILLTPAIVSLVYGNKYSDIVPLMRFMWVTFGINAVFRMPVGNILASMGLVRFNLIVSLCSAAVHLALDVVCIYFLGINGAAVALTIVYTGAAAAGLIYFRHICKKREAAPV